MKHVGRAAGVVALVAALAVALLMLPRPAKAFGDSGAFHPRVMLTGSRSLEGARTTAAARWSWELTRRTSAHAKYAPGTVRADARGLLAEPFVWWLGDKEPGALTPREVANLRQFFALGGVMFIDDTDPERGEFGRATRRELGRVLTDLSPIPIGPEHVVFRSFYLLRRPYGRVAGPARLDAIVRGGHTLAIFSSHDVAGALAQGLGGTPAFVPAPDGERQREQAVRLAVNIAMFVMCSNYKDDQVHAPYLMRRRARDL